MNPILLTQCNACHDGRTRSFRMLHLYSPEENLLSALLHACIGTNLTHYFNGNKFILDIPSLLRHE